MPEDKGAPKNAFTKRAKLDKEGSFLQKNPMISVFLGNKKFLSSQFCMCCIKHSKIWKLAMVVFMRQ